MNHYPHQPKSTWCQRLGLSSIVILGATLILGGGYGMTTAAILKSGAFQVQQVKAIGIQDPENLTVFLPELRLASLSSENLRIQPSVTKTVTLASRDQSYLATPADDPITSWTLSIEGPQGWASSPLASVLHLEVAQGDTQIVDTPVTTSPGAPITDPQAKIAPAGTPFDVAVTTKDADLSGIENGTKLDSLTLTFTPVQ